MQSNYSRYGRRDDSGPHKIVVPVERQGLAEGYDDDMPDPILDAFLAPYEEREAKAAEADESTEADGLEPTGYDPLPADSETADQYHERTRRYDEHARA